MQLDDAGAGQLVGRDRVGREERAVDEEHVVPLPREQHGGGGPGGAGSDHDDVVAMALC